jgi:predicted GNAT family N-acyltransferase
MSNWQIVPLKKAHERSTFHCGEPSLDQFIKQYARQNDAKDISRTFVLVREGEQRIFGYYTLAAGEVSRDAMPKELVKNLPRYPIPAVVLARLAIDSLIKGERLGRFLIWDALERCVHLSEQIGIFAVLVDSINIAASNFYQHFGFSPFTDQPLRLYQTTAKIRVALNAMQSKD